jgi:4-amino-4-deoxy-L-arabinose transferase-like glycosyltransferase
LTPIFAGFAVFCFYEIIKKIFNSQIAFWSALLLLIHPAFWYYSARGLFPNILFVSFLIFSSYFLVKAGSSLSSIGKIYEKTRKRNYMDFILAGLFLGLAMTVRLSEIIWVGAVIFSLFFIYRKKLRWDQVGIFIIFAIITFSPIFAYNQIFYGNSLMTAYNLNDGGAAGSSGQGIGWLVSFARYVFPFGLHFKNILRNFSNYFVGMFWWLAIPLAVGISFFIRDFIRGKLDKKIKLYLILYGGISLFLFVYYGSWLIYDNPAKEVSVGTSYVRYWLPIYILSLPFTAYIFIKLTNLFRGGQKKIVAVSIMTICFILSARLVFFDKSDGLVMVGANMRDYARIAEEVNRVIEPEAIIVVDRADKIFFPEHQVIQPLRDDQVYKLSPKFSGEVPLYYYGVTLPDRDIAYLYAKKFNPEKIEIRKIRDFGTESLYKFVELK